MNCKYQNGHGSQDIVTVVVVYSTVKKMAAFREL